MAQQLVKPPTRHRRVGRENTHTKTPAGEYAGDESTNGCLPETDVVGQKDAPLSLEAAENLERCRHLAFGWCSQESAIETLPFLFGVVLAQVRRRIFQPSERRERGLA